MLNNYESIFIVKPTLGEEATKEVVGEKKAEQIQDKANANRIDKTYTGSAEQILIAGDGDSLFYEPLSGRYFRSNWNSVSKGCNELNSEALGGGYFGTISLNDWFAKLGLDAIDAGDILGWDLTKDPSNIIKIELTSHITKDGKPCACIKYKRDPDKLKNSVY